MFGQSFGMCYVGVESKAWRDLCDQEGLWKPSSILKDRGGGGGGGSDYIKICRLYVILCILNQRRISLTSDGDVPN